ncbi:hypothetical protein CFC35_05875 [Streptomyces sp. FBKL.4005]|uniref:hypothetical protein n=1 Tax=unclassified Streptomyces TaxID=2593676 RepID=UPI000B97B8AD|nr:MULTISPECIES: hypothetical protein [unclassified Streptomyces]OYP14090.1 hypothetical protein CFC35_05875 [Streptomyces sp. FBKL.4005]BCM70839.1 hypothetical protein EASAB2608_06173 [Streptomyces sp. EAS-AB2608]
MARDMTGAGRVTIFPFLHDWETGSRCILAYTTADNGLTAVLGVIPVEGNVHEPGDLFAMAARHHFIGEWKGSHEQRCGCWLACTGSGSRTVRKTGTIDVPETKWTVDMARAVDLDSPYYGHSRVVAGRFTLADTELAERARALVPGALASV